MTSEPSTPPSTPPGTPPAQDAPKVMMLPPTMLLMFVCGGIVLDWALPVNFGHFWGWFGLILLSTAFGITHWAKVCFKRANTNVAPNKPATAIVCDGPFRYSRNPMYLSFVIGYLGLAMLADAPIMLLLVIPLYILLDQKIIVPEEEYLGEKFGHTYFTYKSQTRRWF